MLVENIVNFPNGYLFPGLEIPNNAISVQTAPVFSIILSLFILITFLFCWPFTSSDIFHTLCLNVVEEFHLHDAGPFPAVTDRTPLFAWLEELLALPKYLEQLIIAWAADFAIYWQPSFHSATFTHSAQFFTPHIQSSSMSFTNIHKGAATVETAATVAVITTTSFKILNKPILSPLIGHKPCPCRRRSSIGQYQYHLVLLIQPYAGIRRYLLQ